jgi:hypothetical protein
VTTLGRGAFFFSAAGGGSVAIATSWPVNAATRRAANHERQRRGGLGLRGEEGPREGSGGAGGQTNAAARWILAIWPEGGGEVEWAGGPGLVIQSWADPTVNNAAQEKLLSP